MPDVLTESDLFLNLDPSVLLTQPEPADKRPSSSQGWSSQLLSEPPSTEAPRAAVTEIPHLEDDTGLELDLGEDGMPLESGAPPEQPTEHDVSVEVGRDAPAPRPAEDDLYSDDRMPEEEFALGDDNAPLEKSSVAGTNDNLDSILRQEGDLAMGEAEELDRPMAEESTILAHDEGENQPEVQEEIQEKGQEERRSMRESASPLSSARSSVVRELEGAFMGEDVTEETRQPRQRAKRRKVVQPDANTMISSRELKEMQTDRSAILRPASILPRDPLLLRLMLMQKSGGFVSEAMSGGLDLAWAPELRNMLSLDNVRATGQLKRKREGSVGTTVSEQIPQPELDIQEDTAVMEEGIIDTGDTTAHMESEINIPADSSPRREEPLHETRSPSAAPPAEEAEFPAPAEMAMPSPPQEELDTGAPIPIGPISLGTQRAVHVLREQFSNQGAGPSSSPASLRSSPIVFQDLLPEHQASRGDATRLFFEMLVLATKDAVRVEQDDSRNVLGGPLHITAKQGLWGEWAEDQEMGAEASTQEQQVGATA